GEGPVELKVRHFNWSRHIDANGGGVGASDHRRQAGTITDSGQTQGPGAVDHHWGFKMVVTRRDEDRGWSGSGKRYADRLIDRRGFVPWRIPVTSCPKPLDRDGTVAK